MKELEYPFDSDYILQHKKSIKRELQKQDGLIEKRIALLSGSTIGETKNVLELFLLQNGIRPVFFEGEYDRFYEDAVFENSELKEFQPEYIYVHTTNKNLQFIPNPGDSKEIAEKKLDAEFLRFQTVWEKLRDRFRCPVIQNNFEPLPYRVLGNRDCSDFGGGLYYIHELNRRLSEYARENTAFYINDIEYQAASFGLDRWFDHAKWYMYKYAFSLEAIPMVAFQIANIIKAILGKNKKAVALDLDYTLWGGVIGDDGVENLKLGIETSEGMAYEEFQQYLKKLSMTGICLNLCSKNDEKLALEGFHHPSAVLSEKDFICKKINWENKDLNIHAMAKELNIGEDAIVFIDDNQVEQGIVAENTDSAVLRVGAPESYVTILDRSGYFENVSITLDDQKRNEYFKENLERSQEQSCFTEYQDYLKALSMNCSITPVQTQNAARVTQLINKTNQFNLKTQRFTSEEVDQFAADENTFFFCGQLVDKYGDNGIVSVILAKVNENIAEIELWLMSCRVFKRDLELAMFDELVHLCQNRNLKTIKGSYYRTKKNELVASFYGQLGFACVEEDAEHSIWEYDIPVRYERKNTVIEVTP